MTRQDRPARRPQDLLYVLSEKGKGVIAYRSALARLAQTGNDLLPTERLCGATALGHQQCCCLHRGEPTATLRTGTPTADDRAVLGRSTVEDPAVGMPTERAVHVDQPLHRSKAHHS